MKTELALELSADERADYGFSFEPCSKCVRAEFAGVVAADSTDAITDDQPPSTQHWYDE